MSISTATVNPSYGTIRVILGSDDENTSLSTEHLLAPWPVDDHCEHIASEALSGMGWTVVAKHGLPATPDGEFTFDVAPSDSEAAAAPPPEDDLESRLGDPSPSPAELEPSTVEPEPS